MACLERSRRLPVRASRGQRAVERALAYWDKPTQQFDFVYFLEGREGERKAVVADAKALAQTCDRPKWDIVQP
jgi:hypothetical protein